MEGVAGITQQSLLDTQNNGTASLEEFDRDPFPYDGGIPVMESTGRDVLALEMHHNIGYLDTREFGKAAAPCGTSFGDEYSDGNSYELMGSSSTYDPNHPNDYSNRNEFLVPQSSYAINGQYDAVPKEEHKYEHQEEKYVPVDRNYQQQHQEQMNRPPHPRQIPIFPVKTADPTTCSQYAPMRTNSFPVSRARPLSTSSSSSANARRNNQRSAPKKEPPLDPTRVEEEVARNVSQILSATKQQRAAALESSIRQALPAPQQRPATSITCPDCNKAVSTTRNLHRHRQCCPKRSGRSLVTISTTPLPPQNNNLEAQQQQQHLLFHQQQQAAQNLNQQMMNNVNEEHVYTDWSQSSVSTPTSQSLPPLRDDPYMGVAVMNLYSDQGIHQNGHNMDNSDHYAEFNNMDPNCGFSIPSSRQSEDSQCLNPLSLDVEDASGGRESSNTSLGSAHSHSIGGSSGNSQPFTCEACKKTVSSYRSLKRHHTTCKAFAQEYPHLLEQEKAKSEAHKAKARQRKMLRDGPDAVQGAENAAAQFSESGQSQLPPVPPISLPVRDFLAQVDPSKQLSHLQSLPAAIRMQQSNNSASDAATAQQDVKPEFSRLRSLLEGTPSTSTNEPKRESFRGFISSNAPERVYRVGPGPSAIQSQAYQMSNQQIQVSPQFQPPIYGHQQESLRPSFSTASDALPGNCLSVDTSLPRTAPVSFYSGPPSEPVNGQMSAPQSFPNSVLSPDDMMIIKLRRSESATDVNRQRNPSTVSLPTPRMNDSGCNVEAAPGTSFSVPESRPLSVMTSEGSPAQSHPSPDSSSSSTSNMANTTCEDCHRQLCSASNLKRHRATCKSAMHKSDGSPSSQPAMSPTKSMQWSSSGEMGARERQILDRSYAAAVAATQRERDQRARLGQLNLSALGQQQQMQPMQQSPQPQQHQHYVVVGSEQAPPKPWITVGEHLKAQHVQQKINQQNKGDAAQQSPVLSSASGSQHSLTSTVCPNSASAAAASLAAKQPNVLISTFALPGESGGNQTANAESLNVHGHQQNTFVEPRSAPPTLPPPLCSPAAPVQRSYSMQQNQQLFFPQHNMVPMQQQQQCQSVNLDCSFSDSEHLLVDDHIGYGFGSSTEESDCFSDLDDNDMDLIPNGSASREVMLNGYSSVARNAFPSAAQQQEQQSQQQFVHQPQHSDGAALRAALLDEDGPTVQQQQQHEQQQEQQYLRPPMAENLLTTPQKFGQRPPTSFATSTPTSKTGPQPVGSNQGNKHLPLQSIITTEPLPGDRLSCTFSPSERSGHPQEGMIQGMHQQNIGNSGLCHQPFDALQESIPLETLDYGVVPQMHSTHQAAQPHHMQPQHQQMTSTASGIIMTSPQQMNGPPMQHQLSHPPMSMGNTTTSSSSSSSTPQKDGSDLRFQCPECLKIYSCRKNVKRHRMAVHKLTLEEIAAHPAPGDLPSTHANVLRDMGVPGAAQPVQFVLQQHSMKSGRTIMGASMQWKSEELDMDEDASVETARIAAELKREAEQAQAGMLEAKKPVAELAEADTTFNEEAEEGTREAEQQRQPQQQAPVLQIQVQPILHHEENWNRMRMSSSSASQSPALPAPQKRPTKKEGPHICADCNRILSSDYSLKRHRQTCPEAKAKEKKQIDEGIPIDINQPSVNDPMVGHTPQQHQMMRPVQMSSYNSGGTDTENSSLNQVDSKDWNKGEVDPHEDAPDSTTNQSRVDSSASPGAISSPSDSSGNNSQTGMCRKRNPSRGSVSHDGEPQSKLPRHLCQACGKFYSSEWNLERHRRESCPLKVGPPKKEPRVTDTPNSEDTIIVVGTVKFAVSKQALSRSSAYFCSLFQYHDPTKGELRVDVDPNEFQMILDAHNNPLSITAENIDAVVSLAGKLKFNTVYDHCEKFISDKLPSISVMHAIRLAENLKMASVKQRLFDSITIDVFRSLSADHNYRLMGADLKAELLEKWGTFLLLVHLCFLYAGLNK